MSYKLLEYHCEDCGLTGESLERRGEIPPEKPCECGGVARKCISAAKWRQVWGAVVTGTSDPRPPEAMDTRPLAEGQKWSEWKKHRRRKRRDEVWSLAKSQGYL